MKVRLDQNHSDYLQTMREDGMGYQKVSIKLLDGTVMENMVVENSEFLIMNDDETNISTNSIVEVTKQ
jgi:hypothetical protein